jgi:hypothetical protein
MKRGRLGGLDALLALGLAVVVSVVFCVAYGRTSRSSWSVPITYRGDSLFLLGYLKAAQDGHVFPGANLSVPQLNAPAGANWNDHPRTLRTTFFLTGLFARVVGLFAALNLLLLLAHAAAAASFYAAARLLGARVEWALSGGLTFGLAHYFFWRTLDHLDLVLAWHIPLCVLVSAWAFSRKSVSWASRRFVVSALVVVVAGLQNPYYACLFGQFLLLAGLAQGARRARMRQVLGPLALAILLVAVFALDNAGSLAYQWKNGPNPGASRPYGNLERFSLKPLELVIPEPGFGLANWGRLAKVHWEGRLYKGEGGSQYLGIVGAGALLWLFGVAVVGFWSRAAKAPPATLLAVGWILAFSSLGGLNQLAGLAGFVWLRGTNRFSIWILVLALIFLCTRRAKSRVASVVAAAAVAVLSIADQVPVRARDGEIGRTRLEVESDRAFVHLAEASLPGGSMLFMLPVTDFPEGRPTLEAKEYDNLRPYLFSDALRFSFGTDKGRRQDVWQKEVAGRPPLDLASALEGCGFRGIVVNRKAYPSDASALLEEWRRGGREVLVPRGRATFALVRLRPSTSTEGLTAESISTETTSTCGGRPATVRLSLLSAR